MMENKVLKAAPWTLLIGTWMIGVGQILNTLPI